MNKTVAVANYFIALGIKEQLVDNAPPKINALVYFAHGWFLGLTGKPLVDSEYVATSTGPELPSLMRMMRPYGNSRITDLLRVLTPDPKVPGRATRAAPIIPANSPLNVVLSKVWKGLGRVGYYTLSDLSCAPYTPWASVWYSADKQARGQAIITDERLQAWFSERRQKIGGRMDISLDALKMTTYSRFAGGNVEEESN